MPLLYKTIIKAFMLVAILYVDTNTVSYCTLIAIAIAISYVATIEIFPWVNGYIDIATISNVYHFYALSCV